MVPEPAKQRKKGKSIYVQKKPKRSHCAHSHLDHGAFLLPEVRVWRILIAGDHAGRVPPPHRRRGALHHHQPDGRRSRLWVRSVLLCGIFAPAVVHNTRYQKHQEQDNIAGDEDTKVQSDGVDLLVVFQKAHGARLMLSVPEARRSNSSEDRSTKDASPQQGFLLPLTRPPWTVSHLSVSEGRLGNEALR